MKTFTLLNFILLACVAAVPLRAAAEEFPLKKHSAFYASESLAKIRENLSKHPDAAGVRKKAVSAAAFWKNLPDDQLWEMIFGPGITRSWMVWSDGNCPACKKPVKMYDWKIETQKLPWKLRCPNCQELFPKNDFAAFYRSGLNERGLFDPKKANRALLFNSEHPDAADPLHHFGVDDGEGYVEGGKRWRFIGAYLIYGQFKQLILGGAKSLANAYVLTGEKIYAHKAGVLLDRVADVYPDFDFAAQGLVYERGGITGYISVWHDACEETRELAQSYDQIFEGLRDDTALVEFLSNKSRAFPMPNPKNSMADIQRNIEGRILRNALAHAERIHSNFPRDLITAAVIHTVLDWPENRKQVEALIDAFVKPATAIDGVTGEKGLAGYTSYTIAGMANFLEEFSRSDPNFLRDTLQRNPGLKQTYRFHIDTLCLDRYYPNSGDCGVFAAPMDRYVGAWFDKSEATPLAPSMFSFFWRLYELTGDPAYVQILYRENGNSLKGLPHDLFSENSEAIRKKIAQVIKRDGTKLKLASINKEAWHIGILRSGREKNQRALSLDYDVGGGHGHLDGMTLGLFGLGLDLLPDFGYPPVQFGGWETPKANWYRMTAAHNTVVVDNNNQVGGAGKTTLWANGENFHAMRVSGANLIGGQQYERTAALIDVSPEQFYALDIFRVVGGSSHAKFVYGPFGEISPAGLELKPATNVVPGAQLRNFSSDLQPTPGWSIHWKIEDRLHVLPRPAKIGMNYTDLSTGVEAVTAEAWIAPAYHVKNNPPENWIPSVITKRRGAAPLASTFVSVLEPFSGKSAIAKIRRLPLLAPSGETFPDANVAVEIELLSGERDLIIAADTENPRQLVPSRSRDHILIQPDWQVQLDGELCWIRKTARNKVERIAWARSKFVQIGQKIFQAEEGNDFAERKP